MQQGDDVRPETAHGLQPLGAQLFFMEQGVFQAHGFFAP